MNSVIASDLPLCPNSPKRKQQCVLILDEWHNCVGLFESSGTVYVGEFSNGEFHRTGTIFYTAGKTYEGEFKFGIPFGKVLIMYTYGGSKLSCYGHVRRYGVFFCKVPTVLHNAFNNLFEKQCKQFRLIFENMNMRQW